MADTIAAGAEAPHAQVKGEGAAAATSPPDTELPRHQQPDQAAAGEGAVKAEVKAEPAAAAAAAAAAGADAAAAAPANGAGPEPNAAAPADGAGAGAGAAFAAPLSKGPPQNLTFSWLGDPIMDGQYYHYSAFMFCEVQYTVGDHVYLIPGEARARGGAEAGGCRATVHSQGLDGMSSPVAPAGARMRMRARARACSAPCAPLLTARPAPTRRRRRAQRTWPRRCTSRA